MLYSLPTETKIDIFKFLSYADLCSIKRTNLYLRDFIYEFEGDLALEKFYEISIDYFHREYFLREYSRKLIKPKAENFNFPLNEQLEKRWKNGLEEPIPLYLPNLSSNKNVLIWLFKGDYNGRNLYLLLQLPTIIKSKEDIKIVYYYLNKLFNCSFEHVSMENYIFNPELIQLLFENSSKQFYIQKCWLFMENFSENKLKFALNYLCVSGTLTITFPPNKDMTNYTDILFEILMNGDKFNEVHLNSNNLQTLFDIIINVSFSP
ncbi:unnamed protein product [Meloidogyne enterolobii]|uniref:Uncharacterized protein n=1 Tax=Meloidogyne enterolobii TaxID=390850 RepID=A0ACB0YSB4_MELEN